MGKGELASEINAEAAAVSDGPGAVTEVGLGSVGGCGGVAVGSSAVRPGYCHRLNSWVIMSEKRMGTQLSSQRLKKGVMWCAEVVSKTSCVGREVSPYPERKEYER